MTIALCLIAAWLAFNIAVAGIRIWVTSPARLRRRSTGFAAKTTSVARLTSPLLKRR